MGDEDTNAMDTDRSATDQPSESSNSGRLVHMNSSSP